MKNWLVVANAARARILEESAKVGRYEPVADLVHPQSRQKGSELAYDRPGHVEGAGHGLGSNSYVHRTDPREREHDRFAHEVAEAVNQGVAGGRCAGVVLVASNPFLGAVKSHLSTQARKALLNTVASDLTALDDRELAKRFAAQEGQP
jgi:protein required for attachment to host cells